MGCAVTCACNDIMMNTKTGCLSSRAVEKRAWVINRTDSTGALNYIDLSGTLDNTYFSALINQLDATKRLFPLPECKNITDVREKSVLYAWKDGTMIKVRDGIRKFDGMFPIASPQFLTILQAQRCAEPCKFSIDANGTIWGRLSSDGTKLYPKRMDAGSIDAVYANPTDSEPEMIAYSFNLAPSERDCDTRGLKASELVGGIQPLDFEGLMDVNMKVLTPPDHITDIMVVRLFDNYGSILSGQEEVVTGLVAADFAAAMSTSTTPFTTFSANTIVSVVEAPAGTYTITLTAPTAAHAVRLLHGATPKAGFDMSSFALTNMIVT